MKSKALCLIILFLAYGSSDAFEEDGAPSPKLSIRGRFTYSLSASRNSAPFSWNYQSSSLANKTRLMLDLKTYRGCLGELYLKGKASWEPGEVKEGKKLFVFEQGDYSWSSQKKELELTFFANERRFFSGEMIAPLIHDDVVASGMDNMGVNLNGNYGEHFNARTVLASIGKNWDESRKMVFAKAAFLWPHFNVSLSYLYDYPPKDIWLRHAMLKAELSFFYRGSSLLLSYEQSGLEKEGVFVPNLDLNFKDLSGGYFNRIFSKDGAFFSELRLFKLPLGKIGDFSLVHSYYAVGREFVSGFGVADGERIGNFLGGYFLAKDVFLNAHVKGGRLSRWFSENETKDRLEAGMRGALRGGQEFVLRGGVSRIKEDERPAYTEGHFLGGAEFPQKKVRNGIYLLLKDNAWGSWHRAVAWDSRFAFSPDLALSFRFMMSKERISANSVFVKCEFRPSNRFYACISYGRNYIGDAPYLLEDADISSINSSNAVYSVAVRGDF